MSTDTLFPKISRSYIEQCQFSSWYPAFSHISPRATVIRPLSTEFRQYLEEDSVVVPDGSEDFPPTSSLSDHSGSDTDDDDNPEKRYAFPELDAQIRHAIARYGAVFPKLNWTSPKDASWILPTLKCTSPVDVYLLLKSSDFLSHDLDPSLAFEGCTDEVAEDLSRLHDLELVLKKWYLVDRGREFRCFVRNETLLGISQRDINYYPHLNDQSTQAKILSTILEFWHSNIRRKFEGGNYYIFDALLTRDLSSAHLLDINPYHPKTDPLLFTYDELLQLLTSSHDSSDGEGIRNSLTPVIHVIESPSDPAATRNSPANQHNAAPFDALQMSTGQAIDMFADRWKKEITRALSYDPDSDVDS